MKRYWLILILIIGFILRVWRIELPPTYIFDEVYHVPSLRAFAQNNPEAFDVYAKAPEPNTAYDWLHPPLAKLIQAGSVLVLGDNSFGWRFPAAVFGTLAIAAVYYLALTVIGKTSIALLAAALFSLDGLALTMSRIAMNDIFVTTFILFALAFFYKKNWLLTAIFTGLAISTKHSAVLLYPIFIVFLLKRSVLAQQGRTLLLLILVPPLIYLLSFSQFWLQGHTVQQFIELHKQIYYYQTHLTATHSYQSAAWQWPLLIRPVWFHVEYLGEKIANIYNLGNPIIFWLGLMALIKGLSFFKGPFWRSQAGPYRYLLISFLGLWLPFLASPRIMFLHHYLPALSVLTIILAQWLWSTKNKLLITCCLLLVALIFIFFYPLNTGLPLPADKLSQWFWLPGWR